MRDITIHIHDNPLNSDGTHKETITCSFFYEEYSKPHWLTRNRKSEIKEFYFYLVASHLNKSSPYHGAMDEMLEQVAAFRNFDLHNMRIGKIIFTEGNFQSRANVRFRTNPEVQYPGQYNFNFGGYCLDIQLPQRRERKGELVFNHDQLFGAILNAQYSAAQIVNPENIQPIIYQFNIQKDILI